MTGPFRSEAAPSGAAMEIEVFYRYGYRGREMAAIRAPFDMSQEAELVGRVVRIGGETFVVRAVARQASGRIARGEPFGIEIAALTTGICPSESARPSARA